MASRREFAVDVENAAGGTVVRVAGELDLATSPELEAVLERIDPGGRLVVDLSECEFVDSSGVRVLLSRAATSESTGGRVAVVAPDPPIRRVLELAGADSRVQIHDTRDAALAT